MEKRRTQPEKEILRTLWFLLLLAAALYVAVRYRPDRLPVMGGTSVPATSGRATADPGGYLAEFRMERERLHEKQISLIKEMLDRSDLDPEFRQAYQAAYLKLVDSMGRELEIEGILKSKGWDAVAFLSEDSCTVAVRSRELSSSEVVAIADVVQRVTGLEAHKIAVVVSVGE